MYMLFTLRWPWEEQWKSCTAWGTFNDSKRGTVASPQIIPPLKLPTARATGSPRPTPHSPSPPCFHVTWQVLHQCKQSSPSLFLSKPAKTIVARRAIKAFREIQTKFRIDFEAELKNWRPKWWRKRKRFSLCPLPEALSGSSITRPFPLLRLSSLLPGTAQGKPEKNTKKTTTRQRTGRWRG